MNKYVERIYNGIIKENPTFILMLGMCPTLAVTTSAINGIGMGLSTTAVLVMSNLFVALLRNIIPERVRIPAYIVVIASLTTIVQMIIKAYFPALDKTLGIYIPLIVVNCIIFGRAEAYAGKNTTILSAFDGIGMGLGFTLGLTLIGVFRELLGSGYAFGLKVTPASFEPMSIFVLAPGAFFVLAGLTAVQNKLKLPSASNKDSEEDGSCGGCSGCNTAKDNEDNNKGKE